MLFLLLAVGMGSKIPSCYLSGQQFLTCLTFLATVDWVGYFKYPLKKKGFFMGGTVKVNHKSPVTLIL